MDTIKELIKKIELQSILVLFITCLLGYLLLKDNNNFNTPAGILGSVSIIIGLLYTLISFFSNQIRESYENVIRVYQDTIKTMNANYGAMQKSFKKAMTNSGSTGVAGGYKSLKDDQDGTEKE